ncbi:hypothetical protein GEMRC1_004952 [Eukaryota sp. GEM-RC1]
MSSLGSRAGVCVNVISSLHFLFKFIPISPKLMSSLQSFTCLSPSLTAKIVAPIFIRILQKNQSTLSPREIDYLSVVYSHCHRHLYQISRKTLPSWNFVVSNPQLATSLNCFGVAAADPRNFTWLKSVFHPISVTIQTEKVILQHLVEPEIKPKELVSTIKEDSMESNVGNAFRKDVNQTVTDTSNVEAVEPMVEQLHYVTEPSLLEDNTIETKMEEDVDVIAHTNHTVMIGDGIELCLDDPDSDELSD